MRRRTARSFESSVWERKDLERFVSSKPALARRYRLDIGISLHTVHTAHLLYVLRPCFNSLGHFFQVLDKLDPVARDHLFGWAYVHVINPRFRNPKTGKETMGELRIDAVDYPAFRAKSYELWRSRSMSDDAHLRRYVACTVPNRQPLQPRQSRRRHDRQNTRQPPSLRSSGQSRKRWSSRIDSALNLLELRRVKEGLRGYPPARHCSGKTSDHQSPENPLNYARRADVIRYR